MTFAVTFSPTEGCEEVTSVPCQETITFAGRFPLLTSNTLEMDTITLFLLVIRSKLKSLTWKRC